MLREGHWPDGPPPIAQQGSDGRAAGQGVPARAAVREDEDWQVLNLHVSVSNAVKSTSRLGYSNGSSICVMLWRDVAPLLLPGTLHMFWEQFTQSRRKVKTTTVRNAIKLRYKTFWNAKLARRLKPYLGRISDGTCPLCNNPDSGTHVSGACSHRYLKELYIERHNEAVAIVGKAIMEGAKGGRLTTLVADAGRHGRVTGLAANDRIPQQVLNNVPESILQCMCPEILFFEKEDGENLSVRLEDLQDVQQRRLCKVHLVEVGYCMEVGYADKHGEKTLQHAELMEHLRAAGYAEVQLHLLIFGNTGGNFRVTASHLRQLGIAITKSLLEKLHFYALKRLEQIVRTRRRLEHLVQQAHAL